MNGVVNFKASFQNTTNHSKLGSMNRTFFLLFFSILSLQCLSQVLPGMEHWNDRYNRANEKEVELSREFLHSHNQKILKVYNCEKGTEGRFIDGLPFVRVELKDTLKYWIPGGMFPTTREDYLNNVLKNKNHAMFFIESVRKDGRLGVRMFREYAFLREGKKLFYLFITSSLGEKEEMKLFDRLFEAKSKAEEEEIENKIKKHQYYKRELIFDFDRQKEAGNRLKLSGGRYSDLLHVITKKGVDYYRFKTNVTVFDLIDREFICDENSNFFLLEGHKIELNQ